MPSTQVLLTFLATAAIFAFIPGPALLYAAAQTLAGGRWTGFMAALGLHIGGYVHVAAAAAGLAVLFHAVPLLYFAVKLFGAAYLVWLGISLLRARADAGDIAALLPAKTGRRAFLESITVEVLNPKTAIFYLSFLPQFVDPAAGLPIWAQFAAFGIVVNLMFSTADIVAVLLAASIMRKLGGSSRVRRVLQRAGGSILVALGAHLALQRS